MRLLFAITIGCFAALLWIAISIFRRVRRAYLLRKRAASQPSSTYAKQEFFEAGEFRTPRPLRLDQEILRRKPRPSLTEISFAVERRALPVEQAPQTPKNHRSPDPIPIRPATFASLFGQTIPVVRIDSPNDPQVRPPAPLVPAPAAESAIANAAPLSVPVEFTLSRKPPQTASASGMRRVDPSQYHEDMGDLTDLYIQRASGTQGTMPLGRSNR